jgi:fatty-acyl-CoA synthase
MELADATDWKTETPPVTVAELLTRAVARFPELDAAIDAATGEKLTFTELGRAAQAVSAALAERLSPGARVAVIAPPGPATAALQLGIQIGGHVAVLLNPLAPRMELEELMRGSLVEAAFYVPALRGFDTAATARAAAQAIPALHLLVELPPRAASIAGAIARTAVPAMQAMPESPRGETIAQLPFTSGTTSAARGVLLSHRAVTLNAWYHAARLDVRSGDVWLSSLPMFHAGGSVLHTLGSLAAGAAQVTLPAFDPANYLQAMVRHRVTHVGAVPTMLTAMLNRPELAELDFSNMRAILSGGSLVPPDLIERTERAFDTRVLVVYGQTECAPALTLVAPDDSAADRRDTVGRALPMVELAIRAGEVCARSATIMSGYDGMPEVTAAAYDAEGWLRTGDLGELDERGFLKITGRLKDLIIRGGENIAPAEIEDVLRGVPGVADAAVLGLPDPYWGEIVAAVLQPATTGLSEAARGSLIEAAHERARARLAAHKIPVRWLVADEMPRTGLGKVQKFVLRGRFAQSVDPANAR